VLTRAQDGHDGAKASKQASLFYEFRLDDMVARSCCRKSGHADRSKHGSPRCRRAMIGMEACVGAHHLSRKPTVTMRD